MEDLEGMGLPPVNLLDRGGGTFQALVEKVLNIKKYDALLHKSLLPKVAMIGMAISAFILALVHLGLKACAAIPARVVEMCGPEHT